MVMKLRIMFEPDERDWIHVWCPDLPGCHSQGKTIEEAKANIKEAIEAFLEVMAEDMIADNRKKHDKLNGANSHDTSEDTVETHFLLVAAE